MRRCAGFAVALALMLAFTACDKGNTQTGDNSLIVSNPMNLNYRFQFDEPGYREAADPVCELFKDKYYLFASKSGGYWSSTDLAHWQFIPCSTIEEIEGYAPSILVRNDSIYYIGSGTGIYVTANPEEDNWTKIDSKFNLGVTDPAFFQDEDGKVYLYWGCSDKDPIEGVEVDPLNGFAPIGQRVTLIEHHIDLYGWEVQGEHNELGTVGWNEGPCMTKHRGKYYLQYASPGTQFRSYADGVYVSDNPLGPYTYVEDNPYSYKPGGFIGGAGHGHTFQDRYGNYWHIATMKISVRHMFERRLGLFPLHIDHEGNFVQHTTWSDYPFEIPQRKADFSEDILPKGWAMLSFDKPTLASSYILGYLPSYAADEQVETWWSAETGNPGEWLELDLKAVQTVNAIQVNFADQDFTIRAPRPYEVYYQYKIEASADREHWVNIVDRSANTADMPHELVVLDTPTEARYIKITNTKELPGKFSISGLRVFGKATGALTYEAKDVQVERGEDGRKISLSWQRDKYANGYIIRVGVKKDQLNKSIMVHDNIYTGRSFNRDSDYYFRIDTFNENGITEGTQLYEAKR